MYPRLSIIAIIAVLVAAVSASPVSVAYLPFIAHTLISTHRSPSPLMLYASYSCLLAVPVINANLVFFLTQGVMRRHSDLELHEVGSSSASAR